MKQDRANLSHVAAAAEVSHPAKQGLVQAFSVYVDTLLVCTATAFMILLTGLYNVEDPQGGYLYVGLAGIEAGPGYVQNAFDTILPGFGSSIVAISLFFAFTTIVAYYYIAETNVMYVNRKSPPLACRGSKNFGANISDVWWPAKCKGSLGAG